jgi:ABC-type antimicrobial peptide transport system permease subunit
VPVTIESLSLRVQKLADRPRFEASLLGFFAANGLWMAVLGLYGVMAYLALQRTQEIGVRMALGANRHDILWMVAAEGLRLIALGTAIGLISALCVTRMLSSLLYEVGPRDPAAIAGSAILLALAAMAATLVPAMRAMRVDPVEALRSE